MYCLTTVIAILVSEVESVVVHIELSSMQRKKMKNVQAVQRDHNVFVFCFTFVRSIPESKIPHFVKNSELVRAGRLNADACLIGHCNLHRNACFTFKVSDFEVASDSNNRS